MSRSGHLGLLAWLDKPVAMATGRTRSGGPLALSAEPRMCPRATLALETKLNSFHLIYSTISERSPVILLRQDWGHYHSAQVIFVSNSSYRYLLIILLYPKTEFLSQDVHRMTEARGKALDTD